jgi:predicted kinase
VILMGIQGSGKSTFYLQNFFHTHVRISRDLLRTRHREEIFLRACLETLQPFVIDKINPTAEDRRPYIQQARTARYRVIGYFFEPDVRGSLTRNRQRPLRQVVPEIALFGTLKKLQPPAYEEGFDELYRVKIAQHDFAVQAMLRK